MCDAIGKVRNTSLGRKLPLEARRRETTRDELDVCVSTFAAQQHSDPWTHRYKRQQPSVQREVLQGHGPRGEYSNNNNNNYYYNYNNNIQ